MSEIKLTKNELRDQQGRLSQLKRYLPTLQLKKAMLQAEVQDARLEIEQLESLFNKLEAEVARGRALLSEKIGLDLSSVARVQKIHKRYENIAGVDVPYYEGADFEPVEYSLFESPPWMDAAIAQLKGLVEARVKVNVVEEKKAALERELREVSIRVNLFEKVLIPRAIGNIKKIKVFLGDQELAAVSQAKVAKNKIEQSRLLKKQEKAVAY